MKVSQMFVDIPVIEYIGNVSLLETAIEDLSYNTKTVKEKTIFFALKGRTSDGTTFIPQAYKKGCRVFVGQTRVQVPEDALLILVEDSRYILSKVSSLFFEEPSKKMTVVGITGTKGKTTITTLLYKILKDVGLKTGVIGTNGIYYGDTYLQTANTTPESYELHKVMHQMLQQGITTCFMEVSSQGLMMSRVEHIDFDIAIFTNMAYDHIGDLEHPTFENYLHWKTHLFDLTKIAIVNHDDRYVNHFIKQNQKVYTYGLDNKSDYQATELQYLFDKRQVGMSFAYHKQHVTKSVLLPVPGKFNVYNALVVLAVADILNQDEQKVISLLNQTTVAGRMELIPNHKQVLAVLDYAHNGFSLENVILTLNHYNYERLIILFGSVGDRSQIRRKELGDVVSKYADIAIITSDNPGHENPQHIIDDIKQSFTDTNCIVYEEIDRQKAIELAASLSKKGDIVVFAGKGHETYQLIGSEKVPFDEKQFIINSFEKEGTISI
ncbi:UDP-N-acetylmuramoyl-L-alanyl-D-glutamate--2,6-diaminopimelate ligase [Carnobacteriaceae bacterium zg-84]|uniref:UDP-N-acetylmuramoyl-L-alanyl-D-glutamate--2, 6-diaminopimelate ligase n=1 Tax=Granulicatella sp. zg-84 TaxID=2678503 RepID=UPI0013C05174|nr:UDP-N-acetylmuramoyl-L-alanyl-D-glutamate--2,6-diaminopimelate ligase [Granulicatella sp. zg-84]NEW66269.1 UDP-N-acetylmuramoyl-L-alanyl-D-glutamate--2,6-diaminopimelate ligase [Granulicatella sp. zg-84]QMI85643.1 UDP-N-acetylmuramoyl-L-alanyl-D-glutamate--2,6-diaminopimelate ligase [Carnobacteriaceae bacterium zg-84]